MATPKSTPKDAQVVAAILKDQGIEDYEPRVINQMLEYIYKYSTSILDDSKTFANHSKKKTIDVSDIKLAIQLQTDKSFATPPPKDVLVELARLKNSNPLPPIRSQSGLRLPNDRYCLWATNFKMKGTKKPATQTQRPTTSSTAKVNMAATSIPKVTPAVNLPSKTGMNLMMSKPPTGGAPSLNIVARPANLQTTVQPAATQVVRLAPGSGLVAAPRTNMATVITSTQPSFHTITQLVAQPPTASFAGTIDQGMKRKMDDTSFD